MRKTLITAITSASILAGCTSPLDNPRLDIILPIYVVEEDAYDLDGLKIDGMAYDYLKEDLEPVRKKIMEETGRNPDINVLVEMNARFLDKNPKDNFVSFQEYKNK